jgi:hypothetical protein
MLGGSGKMSERLNRATYPLVDLVETDFPVSLHNRATRILGLRGKYAFCAGGDIYFHRVSANDKTHFTEDLLILYETCLIDFCRSPDAEAFSPEDCK